MAHPYRQRFINAILGNKDKVEIGGFVIFRNSQTGNADILTKETYDQSDGTFKSIKNKKREDRISFKISQPEPITKEELEEWLE